MSPRYLGCRAVIVRSFARIHETNLKKQGILPLTFVDPADYEPLRETDRMSGHRPRAPGAGGPRHGVITRSTGLRSDPDRHSFTEEQLGWFSRSGSTRSNRRRTTHDFGEEGLNAREGERSPGRRQGHVQARQARRAGPSRRRVYEAMARPRHLARGRPRAGRRVAQNLPRQAQDRVVETYAGEKARRVYGAECPAEPTAAETLDVIPSTSSDQGTADAPVGEVSARST